jgi:hypothetical protein
MKPLIKFFSCINANTLDRLRINDIVYPPPTLVESGHISFVTFIPGNRVKKVYNFH